MISQCVILVGGLGTRLGALTRATPKPLLPVNGKPFLDHLIHRAVRFGFTDIILLAGYLGEQVLDRYAGHHRIAGRDAQVRVIVEREPAGTGGALTYLTDVAGDFFILQNGDSWLDLDLRQFAATVPDSALAKIALRRMDASARYGAVRMDGRRISAFDAAGDDAQGGYINAGIYLLSHDLLNEVSQMPCSLERDIFVPLARAGKLEGEPSDGFFIDIGIPSDYARAEVALRQSLLRPAVFFDRDGVLNHDAGYTHKPGDLRWNEGAIEAVKAINDLGWYVFVVTNQAGVGHGLYTERDVDAFHRRMDEELALRGAHIDEYVYCPFHPAAKLERYRKESRDRKPGPGMIEALLTNWPIDRNNSFLIGDKDSDLAAAAAARLRAYLYDGGDLHAMVTEIVSGVRADQQRPVVQL